jgi:type II secretory pathway pseudopilin PulG
VRNQFWLIPLSKAPWSLAQALPLAVATGIADQLTRLDLLLLVVVVVATAGLALVLGQSIIVPVRRLRARFRQASRLLVTITRRQDEAAQRQEAALPPIETTAELLSLETEEVAALLFPQQAVRAPLTPPAAAPRLPGANGWNNGTNGASGGNGFNGAYGGTEANGLNGNSGANWGDAPRGMGAMDENPPIIDAMPARQVARVPARGPGEAGDRATEALRQARNMAGDWNLRQQRIMADLAAALNATDELSRASAEGQREAVDLGNMVGELLASAR